MTHQIQEELRILCKEIIQMDKSLEKWAEIESCDMFQLDPYNGGFESLEDEFCFSVYLPDGEYWFQFTVEDAKKIANNEMKEIQIRRAE